ncbi:hypothetical protein TVAG_216830 [Trichomonas vaginalis G3]|uniref:Uncharacterized protein n=1 Tax=Trichomonas vaginalis (strain ATCC PRA-98 / G3) TaxID=412133 RepID=A2FE89_TRIV3|nr:hypothetical protein TVAGG3_0233610 [Trichomonas vaginalis G3]EAX96780.1 hypothetical protein TVAG_216830 [Trichomonas vaginalis G3]KAI5552823.1 hypothetical protein TVAGG3_0233610 [Trichomonas vaginalis G3]|eukprot:XP_001309710.1 hypothetical protein [Trichomonas vaginalis G3]
MREYYDNSTNLTQDGFISAWASSLSTYNEANKLTVDCIARDPYQFYNERFVSDTVNDTSSTAIIDFLTTKVSLENYTLIYINRVRWMAIYEIWGEGDHAQWDLIDRRNIYQNPNPFRPPYGDTWTIDKTLCNNTEKGVQKDCTYYAYTFPTMNQKPYSRFKIINTGRNKGDGVGDKFGWADLSISKLLLYGTIIPGRGAFSPLRLKRKEQMLFNFAMFSSL